MRVTGTEGVPVSAPPPRPDDLERMYMPIQPLQGDGSMSRGTILPSPSPCEENTKTGSFAPPLSHRWAPVPFPRVRRVYCTSRAAWNWWKDQAKRVWVHGVLGKVVIACAVGSANALVRHGPT